MTHDNDELPTYLLLAMRGMEPLVEQEIRAKLKVRCAPSLRLLHFLFLLRWPLLMRSLCYRWSTWRFAACRTTPRGKT